MVDRDIVEALQAKLNHLSGTIERLRQRVALPLHEYVKSEDRVLAVERLCQVAIQASIDTCQLAIELAGPVAPPNARAVLEVARNQNIIQSMTWAFLDDYLEVRNEIVHEYETITAENVYLEARKFVEKLPQFIAEVNSYIECKN